MNFDAIFAAFLMTMLVACVMLTAVVAVLAIIHYHHLWWVVVLGLCFWGLVAYEGGRA